MKVHINRKLRLSKSVLVIGALDGVHKGHQTLIEKAKIHSERLGVPLVVYTFDPPPKVYFTNTILLSPLPEKVIRLKALGVDHVIVVSFNANYIDREVNEFLQELIELNPLAIYEGPDFKFGKNREGDIDTLMEYFNVNVLKPVCCDLGIVISSSRIRKLIMEGSYLQAEQLLGWSMSKII